jgi:hypothetical protein
VEEGEEIILENTSSHERGKILYCTSDEFQVSVEGKRETWSQESSEEAFSSSESPHKNI